ncbi:MAG TPA: flavin reductase family protein [Actinomycetales bacterium]|nr:flavin reductase family protein [Actinomycetales bacterium]
MSTAAADSAGDFAVPPVEIGAFRRAVGRFATGVCVVTTFAGRHDHAMTANAFTSVSLDPLLVLVCVEQDARFHEAVIESGTWGVSVLDVTARGEAEWLASPGRPLIGQLDTVAHHRGDVTGVALLDHSLATLECLTENVFPGGDHSIVVGRVVAVGLATDGPGPLIYHRSGYRSLQ